MQEAGLRKALAIYERMMTQLANMDRINLLSDAVRVSFNLEFETLKQESLSLRSDTFMGKVFMMTLQRISKMIDFGAGLAETTPKTYENFSGATDAWEVTKDVKSILIQVIMTIDVNGGTAGERYILKQDSNIIFDTGNNWDTNGKLQNLMILTV